MGSGSRKENLLMAKHQILLTLDTWSNVHWWSTAVSQR